MCHLYTVSVEKAEIWIHRLDVFGEELGNSISVKLSPSAMAGWICGQCKGWVVRCARECRVREFSRTQRLGSTER